MTTTVQLSEMPFFGDVRNPKSPDERRCPCGTTISRYHGSDTCWPCEERDRDRDLHHDQAKINRLRSDTAEREERMRLALESAKGLLQPFSTHVYADATNTSIRGAANTLNGLQDRGLVVNVEERRVQRRGKRVTVAMWRVM